MKKLIILLGVVGVSLSAILVRISSAPSMVMVFYRMFFAAIVLLPVLLIRGREELKKLTKKECLLSILSGVFLALHFTCYFSAVRYTSVAAAVVLVDTEVFFVAIWSRLLWKRSVPPKGWIGIGLTFLGSILIARNDFSGTSIVLLGDGLALLGACFMSVYTVIGTEVRKTRSTTLYTAIVYTAGAVTVGIILLVSGTPVLGYAPQDYLAGVGLALFCTLLGHSVFSWGLHYESPAYVSTVKLLEPVFATILALILFREMPAPQVVIGGVIVIAGVAGYAHWENDLQ